MREKPFQSVGATVLTDKSASEFAVATIIGYLDFRGHQEVMIKSDREQSTKRIAVWLQAATTKTNNRWVQSKGGVIRAMVLWKTHTTLYKGCCAPCVLRKEEVEESSSTRRRRSSTHKGRGVVFEHMYRLSIGLDFEISGNTYDRFLKEKALHNVLCLNSGP